MLTIRKAELRDVPEIYRLINPYAAEHVLLPRTLTDLYENVWEFTVAERNGQLLGCGALKFYNQEIAEIRSLCVDTALKANGIGRTITDNLVEEARRFGLKLVFALTVTPGFFEKLGFRETPRERFPTKVWRDCIGCPLYTECNEIAVSLELSPPSSQDVDAPAEATEVTR